MSDEKKKLSENIEKEVNKSNQIVPEYYSQQGAAGPYNQPPPAFSNQQNFEGMPSHSQQPPAPSYGQQAPSYGQQQPQFYQQAPYDQQYGQPPYDQQYGQQPPASFGQQQPPYGMYDQPKGPYGQQSYDQQQHQYGAFNQQQQQQPQYGVFDQQQQQPQYGVFDQQQQPQPQYGVFDQQQQPPFGQQAPYGQYPPFNPQEQGYPPAGFNGQYPPNPSGYGQQPAAAPAGDDSTIPKFFNATEEQLLEYRDKLRQRFRSTMPFDWLGQADNQWYSSWCMKQENFVAFRLGLTLYAYWAWDKFHGQIGNNTWNSDMEILSDTTSIIRGAVTWLSLLSVFLGMLGVTILSGLQLVLSENSFKTLSSYRVHSSRMGKIINWLVFGMNFHYDAAPITACMALVLTITPNNFYQVKMAQPLWPALTLPILMIMDLWIVKRCRIDTTYIRRNMYLMIFGISFLGLLWAFHFYYIFRGVFGIFTTKSLAAEMAPNLILTLAFVIVAVVGTDSVYNFLKFKSYYLIANHFDKVAARDVKTISTENEEKYVVKREKIRLELEAEHAKYLADLAEQYNQYQGDNGAGTSAGPIESVAAPDNVNTENS